MSTHRIFVAVLVIPTLVAGCMGYVPGRQSYWDDKVKEFCGRDGGVKIFEKLLLTESDVELLGKVDGKIDVPIKQLAKSNAPAYAELRITNIHEGTPSVTRTESMIIRRADQAVIARWIVYSRFGGDFPSPAHPSAFRCPDFKKIASDLQPMFVVERNQK